MYVGRYVFLGNMLVEFFNVINCVVSYERIWIIITFKITGCIHQCIHCFINIGEWAGILVCENYHWFCHDIGLSAMSARFSIKTVNEING